MANKTLRAGAEVDAYCTKCRLLLNHRIIAMVDAVPRKVECATCGSHHLFRAYAPGQKPAAAPRAARPTASPRPFRQTSAGAARSLAETRTRTWEQAVLGKEVSAFAQYSVRSGFKQGDLVRHTKFGDGVVTRIVDANKIEITFRDDARILAQNLALSSGV